jgi:enoyl-CoA hydratase/carnithine racemase
MAGADIAYMQVSQAKGNATAMRAYMDSSNNLLNLIEDGPKPVVAAIAGFAFGGGLELAMVRLHRPRLRVLHVRMLTPSPRIGLQRAAGAPHGSGRSA